MHPTGGSLRVFEPFAWLEAGSGKAALPRPAHQRVTLTVGRLVDNCAEPDMSEEYKDYSKPKEN